MRRGEKGKRKETTPDYLQEVGIIVGELDKLGVNPVLVGGMALVILGSRRVTRDFDFLISTPEENIDQLVGIFYQRGFELASRLDKQGDISETIGNRRVAAARLKIDRPPSAYFINNKTGLRIDLLFDFPLKANEIASRSKKTKVKSYTFRIASKRDLLKLKEIAQRDRRTAADTEDIEFLKKSI